MARKLRSCRERLRLLSPRVSLISLGLGSAIALLPHGSRAQRTSSLPPPPNVNFDLVPVPTQPAPSKKLPPSAPRELIYQAPETPSGLPAAPPATQPGAQLTQRYLVYVNGNSPYLLQQVQRLESQAFVHAFRGQSVIQVGLFEAESNARQQVDQLARQGIGAEVARVQVQQSLGQIGDRGYIVVVPSAQAEFSSLSQQITRLGVSPQAIQPKLAPISPHLQIGPYRDRQDAETINHLLRQSGLDARIYFSR